MIWIKLLGIAMIVSAGGLASATAARYEKRKLTVPEAWLDLIFYIRSQIDCYLTPLDEILFSADPKLFRDCMCHKEHPSLHELFIASQPYLTREGERLISAFVRELGGGYREEQVRRCDYYTETLRTVRDKISEELPSRIKLAVTISLCAAIGTAILLW